MVDNQRVNDIPKRFRSIDLRKMLSGIRQVPLFPIVILLFFVISGLFGGWFAPYDPLKHNLSEAFVPPFWQETGSTKHLLGTDNLGRDMLSRLIIGAGVSLQVAFITIFVAGAIGSSVALLAGFLGGWVDIVLMRLVDIVFSLPFIVIAVALATVLGPSKTNIIIILTLLMWAGYARILRGEVLRIKENDFISLAVVAGASKSRIMLRHIFPNIVNTLVVLATLQLGTVIIAEASLSYLGLGVPPPEPAWGSMIADGTPSLYSAWWPATIPGIAIMLVVLSCNLLGDWLRVRLDPKFKQI